MFSGWEVLIGLYISWIRPNANFCEYSTTEAHFWLFYATVFAVEDQTIFASCLHELDGVVIMFFGCLTGNTDGIMCGSVTG